MNFWGLCLKIVGWKVDIEVPNINKCLICVAPHTSNWDFPAGLFAYKSVGRKANFLMKSFWFFFPLNFLMKALGGIPVYRSGEKNSLTLQIIDLFNKKEFIHLAVTPEGTRKGVETWKTGFLYIAYGAKVPIQLGVIDYKEKMVVIRKQYNPTGDIDQDMGNIKKYYAAFADSAKFPSNFKI